jgi:hypothetical protein
LSQTGNPHSSLHNNHCPHFILSFVNNKEVYGGGAHKYIFIYKNKGTVERDSALIFRRFIAILRDRVMRRRLALYVRLNIVHRFAPIPCPSNSPPALCAVSDDVKTLLNFDNARSYGKRRKFRLSRNNTD